jgi:type I restriction enzyme, S subunit
VTADSASNGLPPGWTMAKLADIAECRLGKMLDQQKNRGKPRPYLRNANVQWGGVDLDDIKEMRIEADERDKYGVLPGDVLVCEGGEPGRCAVWREEREMYLQKALHRVRPRPGVSPGFIRWWLQYTASSGGLDDMFTGSTIKHLPGRQLARVPIPVPPPDEQQRIADMLDEIDGSRARIQRRIEVARARLDRLRDVLRTAACAGELTASWRESDDLRGWEELRLDEVCESIADGDHQAPPKVASGIPFITISAMNDGHLNLDRATRFVPESYYDALTPTRRPKPGDVLFSVTGSIGIPAIVDTAERFTFQRHIAILRPDESRLETKYLYYVLGTDDVRQQGLGVATGTAQLTIPLGGLRAFRALLPPVDEQREIVKRLEAYLSTVDVLACQVDTAEATLERVSRCVLSKAFRGELVRTDAVVVRAGETPRSKPRAI